MGKNQMESRFEFLIYKNVKIIQKFKNINLKKLFIFIINICIFN